MPNNPNIIEPCEGYRVGDSLYPILAEAQKAALARLLEWQIESKGVGDVIAHREEVIKILSLKEPKQRKPRADKGTHRQRKSFSVPSATVAGKP